MKRSIITALSIILCLMMYAAHANGKLNRYQYIWFATSELTINGSMAICSGSATPRNDDHLGRIEVILQKKTGNVWSSVKSWNAIGLSGETISYTGTEAISTGNKYRVKVIVQILNENNNIIETEIFISAVASS